jgi:hypothetical protein
MLAQGSRRRGFGWYHIIEVLIGAFLALFVSTFFSTIP